jgi:acyl dehydratase
MLNWKAGWKEAALPDVEALHALEGRVGQRLRTSDWFAFEQDQVDDFARAIRDWDPQHNDPVAARNGPFGGTIAHGYLGLSMTSHFMTEAGIPVQSSPELRGLNYGLDRVRFPHAIRVGAPARWHMDLLGYEQTPSGAVRLLLRTTIEMKGATKPSMVADAIFLYVPAGVDIRR